MDVRSDYPNYEDALTLPRDADLYIIRNVLNSIFNMVENQHKFTRDLLEHPWLSFSKAAWMASDGRGSFADSGKSFLSSQRLADRILLSSSFLSKGYRSFFPLSQSGRSMKLTITLPLVLRTTKCLCMKPVPIRVHGAVLS
jgi:hypothetical protein